MERLRRLRTEKGLSQARLAARAELDPSTVNQIERGAREASPATLRKLAGALDVGIVDLLEDTSPKAPSRSSLEPSLFYGSEDERRDPTAAERNAIQAFDHYCDRLQKLVDMLNTRELTETDKSISMVYASGLVAVGSIMPVLGEHEAVRQELRPIAARFVALGRAFVELVEKAGTEPDEDLGIVIQAAERFARAS